MTKTKKGLIYFLVSVIFMLTGLFFVACGKTDRYANVTLRPSTQNVSLFVGEKTEMYFEIENYTVDMDNTLNFAIETTSNDSTDSTISGERASIEVIAKNNERVTVEITALSSGQSTIVASMKEGYKQCSVNLNVKQYSQSFKVDSEKIMYITLGNEIYPNKDYFIFDEGTTEKELKFYFADNEANISSSNEFTHIDFNEVGGNKVVRFFSENNTTIGTQNCNVDGSNFPFYVQYTYIEKGEDGNDVPITLTKQTSLIALFGIDENDVQIYEGVNEGYLVGKVADKYNFDIDFIIKNNTENKLTYYVTIPTFDNLDLNLMMKNEFNLDNTAVNIATRDVTDLYSAKNDLTNLKLYEITLNSNIIKATNCNLLIQVYYSFTNGQSFKNEDDFGVNYGLTIPISVKLMPEKLEVVDTNENIVTGSKTGQENGSNKEIYYNYYAGTNYGWVEYKLNVYKTTSEYSGVRVEFEFNKVIVQYRGKIFNSTNNFVVEDTSYPIFVKGVDGATANEEGVILFSVVSDLFGEGEDVVAKLHYEIQEGASSINFTTVDFRSNSIYLQYSKNLNTFEDLYTDKAFKYFTISTKNSEIVMCSNFDIIEEEGKHFLSFNLTPLKVGEEVLTIRLDNGVSTTLKVNVINTFDDVFLTLKNAPQAVIFEEKDAGEGFEGEFELVVRNLTNSDRNSVIYGQKSTLVFDTTYDNSILAVNMEFSTAGIANLLGNSTLLEKTIETANKGKTDITIVVTGVGVEDFKMVTDVEKSLKVTFISFVPVATIKTYNKTSDNEIDNAVVYAQATDVSKTTASIRVLTTPTDAYYFYDVETNEYGLNNVEDYIYWTLSDGVYAYPASNTTERKSLITGREAYYISGKAIFNVNDNYGLFEYDNAGYYKFTVNQRYLQGATFTIYASIRQFGLKKYSSVTINCRQFVAVDEIYTTDDIGEYSFKNAIEKLEFTTYLNPYDATVTGIKCFYVHSTGKVGLLKENVDLTEADGVVITTLKTTTSRAYMLSVQLGAEVVNSLTNVTDIVSGTFYVVPLDWCNSTGQGLEGVDIAKRNRVIRINISFQNGTYENPYVLKTYEDVVAIGSSEINMKANYIVYDMIDLSKVSLPICSVFSGTIRGAKESSGFKNINVTSFKTETDKSFAGMFGIVEENEKGNYNFENLIFEGNIKIENSSYNGSVGLVAGIFEGKAINVSVRLTDTSIVSTSATLLVNAGIMFGELKGTFEQDFSRNYISFGGRYYGGDELKIKVGATTYDVVNNQVEIDGTSYPVFNVVKTAVFAEKEFNISAMKVCAGAIAGMLDGSVTKIDNGDTHYNYASYTVYAKINVGGEATQVSLGGIAGYFVQGSILGVLVGGQYYYKLATLSDASNNFVGGIIGRNDSNNITLKGVTTRAFVRGYNVGAIAGKISGTFTAENLKIQAVDDGIREGINASMITKLTLSSSPSNTGEVYQICGNGMLSSGVVTDGLVSYITRTHVEINNTSTTENRTADEYYGDFIIVQVNNVGLSNSGTIIYQSYFTQMASGGMTIDIPELKRFSLTNDIFATYALYYSANAYYENGVLMVSNLIRKQELLDSVLNTLGVDSYPFAISNGESIWISSKSANVSVNASGNIVLNGPGLAEIEISTLLNRRESVKIYLYVINYFDTEEYLTNLTKKMFYNDTFPFVDNTQFSVITNRVLNISMKAKMDKVLDERENISVSSKGILMINNFAIELASPNPYIDFDIEFNNVGDVYGQVTKYADGFFFSKKTDVETDKDSFDELEITAYLKIVVGGETYYLNLLNVQNLVANYYEGATAILTDYSSYNVITGEKFYDYVGFVSDINEWGDFDGEIQPLYDIFDEKGFPTDLFIVNVYRIGKTNNFKTVVEVNKNSEEFINRFEKNIYGQYKLVYYSTSHGRDGISKEITIYFEEQDVNTIDLTSMNNLANYLSSPQATVNDFVVPNQQGVLQIGVLPTDADFDYIVVENTDINYLSGSTSASFVVGYIKITDNGGVETKSFETIQGASLTPNGIKIAKEKLETSKHFVKNGEFYVRYVFGSTGAINNNPEQIRVSAYKLDSNEAVCSNTINLRLNTKYAIGLRLNGKENKDYVARGLSYDLEVINAGYDAQDIHVSIPTDYASYASISQDGNGNYKLQIANNVVGDYYDGENFKKIVVRVSVDRINADGELKTEDRDIELYIIEYVINYKYSVDKDEDIVSGMKRGVVSTAVGEKTTLSVDFNNWDMIEYNPDNNIKNRIQEFLKDLTEKGTWVSYVDRNDSGAKIYDNPIQDKTQSYKQYFGKDKSFVNYYYKVDGTSFITKTTLNPNEKHVVLTYSGTYHIKNGLYMYGISAESSSFSIGTEFTFNSYIRGSDENPNPIYSYKDFKENMGNPNASYILMNDIVVSASDLVVDDGEDNKFEPVSAAVASFDGNGYKFIFSNYTSLEQNPSKNPSVYDLTEISEIGLFSNISENTVIKNLTIQIGNEFSGNVEFRTSSSASLTVGLVVANNDGVITNSRVVVYEGVDFSVTGNSSSASFMGGLIGVNSGSGFVTHCQSEISVTASFNLSGFVGINNGHIASSFFKGGKINNDVTFSTTGINSAGFVITNNGKIVSSYSSSSREDINFTIADPWSALNDDYDITSSVQSAGFAFKNGENGEISNCYSNVSLSQNNNMAGFVFINEGLCKNDTSFSLVNPSANSNYGFASGESLGSFKNCYYLRDTSMTINNAQNFTNIDGVDYLTLSQFDLTNEANRNNFFTTYNYYVGESDNYMWNYVQNEHRIELVDANIIAFSQKDLNLENTRYNDDGTTLYDYQTAESATAEGSRENPYVISNPEKFENYISNGETLNKYYRIVCELDYGDYASNFSTSYKQNFQGYIFGNEMEITNISLYSVDEIEQAGLFGQISGNTINYACVKDLTIKPTQVSFVNAREVGTLAGRVSYANISNIRVFGTSTDEDPDENSNDDFSVVMGNNLVGGVFGIATNDYIISNIEAKISTMAQTITIDDGTLLPTLNENNFLNYNKSRLSFAGGVVGYLGGSGTIKDVTVRYSNIVSMGSEASFVFGFVGKDATATNIEVNIHKSMLIRAFVYGGIVAGGCYGKLDRVVINGTDSMINIFSGTPYYPNSIGGITGYASGASISNVKMSQSMNMPYQDNLVTKFVPYVGGVVGKLISNNKTLTEISNVVIDASIYAAKNLGGIVGFIDRTSSLSLDSIAIKNIELKVKGRMDTAVLGNFVGECQGILFISNAYSYAKLIVDVYSYEATITTNIGEIFGNVSAIDLSDSLREVTNIFTKNEFEIYMVDKSAIEAGTDILLSNDIEELDAYKELLKTININHNSSGVIDVGSIPNSKLIQGLNVFNAGLPTSYYSRTKAIENNYLQYYRLDTLNVSNIPLFGNDYQINLNTFADNTNDGIWNITRDIYSNVSADLELTFENNF